MFFRHQMNDIIPFQDLAHEHDPALRHTPDRDFEDECIL